MPELPEVQTTVAGLQKVLPGLKIIDVWTDLASTSIRTHSTSSGQAKDTIKNPAYFTTLRKAIIGRKVLSVKRRAKNILIDLDDNLTLLIHMKMTGHLLYGKYAFKKNAWSPAQEGALTDPFNRFLHVVFSLSDGNYLALSDMRKFAKIVIAPTDTIDASLHLGHIGPEPLERNFTFPKFEIALARKPKQKIKLALMDQSIIAGIGNIYSDEILWSSGVNPEEPVKNIPELKMKKMYEAMKLVLKKGIDFSGDSTSDYRNIFGERGEFQLHHNAYRKTGSPCAKRDGGVILRMKIGGRSAHFCSVHQRLSH